MDDFTIKEQIIMCYLRLELPIVDTSIDRDFHVYDIVQSEDGIIYEISAIHETFVYLQNISKKSTFIAVDKNEFYESISTSFNKVHLYKFEKVENVINYMFERRNK